MNSTADWFIEVSDGVKRQIPPKLIKLSDLEPWQIEHQGSIQGLFRSIYMYATNDPYIGGVLSDFYMDFDCEENPDNARKEAIVVVKKLGLELGIPEGNMQIAFSGLKGISLTVDYRIFGAELLEYLPRIWRSIAEELKEQLKLKTVDFAIYEKRRLWRLLNSRHQESGLYKIPLTLAELKMPMEQIMKLAATPRKPISMAVKSISAAKKLFRMHKRKYEKWIKQHYSVIDAKKFIKLGDDPPCVKQRIQLGAKVGQRNPFLFQLAVYYAQKGLNEADICKIGYDFASRCEPGGREFPRSGEVEATVASAYQGSKEGRYSIGCSSDALADLCDKPNCGVYVAKQPKKQEAELRMKIGEPIIYKEWKSVILSNFPWLWKYIETAASTAAINLIKDALPVVIVFMGVSGCGKTTVIYCFLRFEHSHQSDKFTVASFVAHTPHKTAKELEEIDLLPKVKHRLFITPDLSSLFGMDKEKLREVISVLTRVLDGRGLVTDSGTHGTRGYQGDYSFTWIAATTPIQHRVWNIFGNLGARMFFYYMPPKEKTADERIHEIKQAEYAEKVRRCNEATLRFLSGIWEKEQIDWNRQNDPDEVLAIIVELSNLLVKLRGTVRVSIKEDFLSGEKTYFSTPIIEDPNRAVLALYNLARGHAIVNSRRQITKEDLPMLFDVTLSSAPYERILTLKSLLRRNGTISTADLMADLGCSRQTARRAMKTFEVLGLADVDTASVETEGGRQTGFMMTLKSEFNRFLSAEFADLQAADEGIREISTSEGEKQKWKKGSKIRNRNQD